MSRNGRTPAGLLAAFLCGAIPALAAERGAVIRLDAGATTLTGTIRGDAEGRYRLEARAGQALRLRLSPSNRSCYFNLTAPEAAEALHVGASAGDAFEGTLAVAGAYTVQVYLMRNAARRNETCRYRLTVESATLSATLPATPPDAAIRTACRAAAAPMYGVPASRLSLEERMRDLPGGGFALDGTADKGAEGMKRLRCLFRPDRGLDRVMALTPDWE